MRRRTSTPCAVEQGRRSVGIMGETDEIQASGAKTGVLTVAGAIALLLSLALVSFLRARRER